MVLGLRWFPRSAIRAAAALISAADQVRLYCITLRSICLANFKGVEILYLISSLIAHIFPRATLIIHIHDVSLHFGERRVVANNFLRLNTPKHFIVACHEPFFLVAAVIMLRCHISGDSNNAAFFNPLKAKIERGFIAPVYRGNNTDSLGGPVGAAPAVAEHIVKLHNWGHFRYILKSGESTAR